MSVSDSHQPLHAWPVFARAVSGRCPACGRGKFFKSYLRQVDKCADCGEEFGRIHADDGPAWLTIILVGHMVVPSALFAETSFHWPLWISIILWPIMAMAPTLPI